MQPLFVAKYARRCPADMYLGCRQIEWEIIPICFYRQNEKIGEIKWKNMQSELPSLTWTA